MAIPKAKTLDEMNRIREQNSKLVMVQRAEFVPEPNETRPLAVFEVSRYVKGSFTGLFKICQLINEDKDGRPLKRPARKVVSDGNYIEIAIDDLEKAIRRRVFR